MRTEDLSLPDPSLIPEESIPPMLARLAAMQSALAVRLLAGQAGGSQPAPTSPEEEELLTPDQAAVLLRVSVQWMYRHARGLPFTRRLSRKALRFSRAGLLRWRAGRGA